MAIGSDFHLPHDYQTNLYYLYENKEILVITLRSLKFVIPTSITLTLCFSPNPNHFLLRHDSIAATCPGWNTGIERELSWIITHDFLMFCFIMTVRNILDRGNGVSSKYGWLVWTCIVMFFNRCSSKIASASYLTRVWFYHQTSETGMPLTLSPTCDGYVFLAVNVNSYS